MWFVVALHQVPTLFAGLLVYALVHALAPGLQRRVPGVHAHRLVVAILAVLVVVAMWAWGNGEGCAPPATNPAKWAMSTTK